MSKQLFSDKRWNHHSWKGVEFDNSQVTPEQEEKTKEFHELFKKTFAKELRNKHSH